MPDEPAISENECSAYELAYWAARMWGSLQRGWLERRPDSADTLEQALNRLSVFFDRHGDDPGKSRQHKIINHALRSSKSLWGTSDHNVFSAFWRGLCRAWEMPQMGYLRFLLTCSSSLAAIHRVPMEQIQNLHSSVIKAVKDESNSHVLGVKGFGRIAVEQSRQIHGIPEDLTIDLIELLPLLERLVPESPGKTVDDSLIYVVKPGQRVPGMPKPIEAEDFPLRVINRHIHATLNTCEPYQAVSRLWNQVLSYAEALKGRERQWFEAGINLALLQDLPALNEPWVQFVLPPQSKEMYFRRMMEGQVTPKSFAWLKANLSVRKLPLNMLEGIEGGLSAGLWAQEVNERIEREIAASLNIIQSTQATKKSEEVDSTEAKKAAGSQQSDTLSPDDKTASDALPASTESMSFSELTEIFLEKIASSISAPTVGTYRSGLKYVLEMEDLKNKPATKISPMDIEDVKSVMVKKGLSARSINKMIGAVSRLYNWSCSMKIIEENPVPELKKVSRDVNSPKTAPKKYYEKDQAHRYVEICRKKPPLGDMMNMLLKTGMRLGELVNLTWGDVDMEEGFIRIFKHKTSSRTKKPRTIPVNEDVKKILEKQQANQTERDSGDPVFLNENGEPFNTSSVHSRLKRLKKKFPELKDFKPHGLRHTFATQLSRNGVPVATAREILGHGSELMTLYYTGTDLDDMHKAVDTLTEDSGDDS